MEIEFWGGSIKINNNYLVSDKSIVHKTRVLPLNGYIISKYKIIPLEIEPIVKKNGIEHIFLGYDRAGAPVYMVPTPDGGATTTDFEKYTLSDLTILNGYLSPEEVAEKYLEYVSKRHKWFRVMGGHYVMMKENRMHYTDGRAIYVYNAENIDDALNAGPTDFEKILELPKEPRVVDYYTTHSGVFFYLSDGRRVMVETWENFSKIGPVVVPLEETAAAVENGVGMTLNNEVPLLPEEPSEYYDPDYAYDGETLYTPAGAIKTDRITDETLKIILWGHRISTTLAYYFERAGEKYKGALKQRKKNPMRVLGKCYWYNPLTDDYRGPTNLRIATDGRRIEYANGTITISPSLPLPRAVFDKIARGEEVKITEILPGFPEDGKILNSTVETGIKKYRLDFTPRAPGITTVIPYVEGVYKLHIPYGAPADVWSPTSIEDVPKEYIIEPLVTTGSFRDVKTILYDGRTFTLELKDGRIEVGTQITIEYGSKKITLPGNFTDILHSADNLEDLWTIAALL